MGTMFAGELTTPRLPDSNEEIHVRRSRDESITNGFYSCYPAKDTLMMFAY